MMYKKITLDDIKAHAAETPLEIGWDALEEGGNPAIFELLEAFQLAEKSIPDLELEFTKYKIDGSNSMAPHDIVGELLASYKLTDATTKYFSILDLLMDS